MLRPFGLRDWRRGQSPLLRGYFGSPYGSAFFRCRSSRRSRTSLPRRWRLRLRLLPRERLWRRNALAALIFPVPVERNRFAALRLVFSFGIEVRTPACGSGPDTSSRPLDQLLEASARWTAGEGVAAARGAPFCGGG